MQKRILLLIMFIIYSISLFAQHNNTPSIHQLIFSGQYNKSLQILNEKLKTDSSNSEIHYLLGFTYYQQQNFQKATSHFLFVYKQYPDNVDNIKCLANTYLQIGLQSKAESYFKQVIEIDSTREDILNALGKLYYQNTWYKKAHNVYSRLIGTYPQNSYYPYMKARCYIKLDSLYLPNELLNNAYHLDPNNVKIIFELSKNQFQLDSLNRALRSIEKALSLEKTNWQIHRLKGDILFKKQDYLSAILSFLDAISNGDKSILVKKKLGFCYYSDNNYLKCKNTFEEILEQDNEDPIVLYYLGLSYNHLREYDLTIDYMHAAINAIYPKYMDNIYSILAESYYKKEDYKEAITYFKKALEFTEDEEVIFYHLGNVYFDYYRDKSIALEYYEKALKIEISPEITEFIEHQIAEIKKEFFFKK